MTRQEVLKTYKMYINGEFPRSESARSYPIYGTGDKLLAHAVRATRKDLRAAVQAGRAAQLDWAAKTAYNRGQILYRVAEIMETRKNDFVQELAGAITPKRAETEVHQAIDLWVWYAGWTDKFAAVMGGANPVAGPYFNFTVPEPMGVIGAIAGDEAPLLGLVADIAPALVSGNAVVALASEKSPLAGVALGEALAVSDVPKGVVNILTGQKKELAEHFISHADINAVNVSGVEPDHLAEIEALAADSIKRIIKSAGNPSPYKIADYCEMKTIWHPIGK